MERELDPARCIPSAVDTQLFMATTTENPVNLPQSPSAVKPVQPGSEIRRVAYASLVGTTIEWYDFFIYGLAAVLIFGPQFFPSSDPLAGTLAAFATFAVGFAARPLGGIVAGHLGDRIGRKKMLVLTLLLMGTSTTLIGLLPTYASAGVLAPALLIALRLPRHCVGGEWGGAVLISVEHSPGNKKASTEVSPRWEFRPV